MITEYPAEDRRYDQPEYERFWAAAAALDMPLSLHIATRRQGKIRGANPGTLRDASSRATKAFCPPLSLCDLISSGVYKRHRRLSLAIVEFGLAWAPNVLTSMDYTYRERHCEALYRFNDGMRPSDFFRRYHWVLRPGRTQRPRRQLTTGRRRNLVEMVDPGSIAAGDLGLLLFSAARQDLLNDLVAPGEGGLDMGVV